MTDKTIFYWCVLCVTVGVAFGQKALAGLNQNEGVECTLPQLAGNCSQQITRYYYDPEAKQCKKFVYSGCNGNLNNFEFEDECNMRCICLQKKDEGISSHFRTRYFYNDNNKKCESFVFRGVGGNGNRFLTQQDCERMCEPLKAKCKARPNFGRTCDKKIPSTMYYYDIVSGECTSFPHKGCGGSKNRFATKEKCLEACNGRNVDTSTPTPEPEVCFYQPVAGPCNQATIRYYYDFSVRRCLPFAYSGCGGNKNNFETQTACNATCRKYNFNNQAQTTTTVATTTASGARPEACNYDLDQGGCGFSLKRFYFDRTAGTCKEFYWSGCGGNMNRFITRENCLLTCVVV